jgi:ABC-type sulfate transport system substrate-binding protein
MRERGSGVIINNSLVSGNAEWASLAQYLTYKFNDKTTGIL